MINKKIRVSDYIINFFESKGISDVFLISGGGSIYLVDSISKNKNIKFICNHHEQASAIAAEAYARISEGLGACIVTTGPGGTNAITGVMGAWLDSIPMIVISGQVKTETMGAGKILRQLGDQEINIVDIVRPITKYARTVLTPEDIRSTFEEAANIAMSDRPGPVWIDVPLDVQGAMVNPALLKPFVQTQSREELDADQLHKDVQKVLTNIFQAKRPVLFIGNGVRLAHASDQILQLINLLKIPVLTGFAGFDIISSENPYFAGRPGTIGQRAGNFTLQNADSLLVIGSRLNIRMLGYNYQTIAREAFKMVVDIDKSELNKKTISPDMKLQYDAKEFIEEMINQLKSQKNKQEFTEWIHAISNWKIKYPPVLEKYWKQKKFVNPYCFIDSLSKKIKKTDIIALSNATASICTYQALRFPQGTRVITNSGCAAMGYGLPAAIGACVSNKRKRTICIEGDGSIQMNLQELQTIVHNKLPLKIFIYNNSGYLSIRLTQKNLFEKNYAASSEKSGVSCPDMLKIGRAYGIQTEQIANHDEMEKKIKSVLVYPGPVICEILLSPEQEFSPKASSKRLPDGSFVSRPLEDMYPFLSKEELQENMLIPLIDDL
ncbi:acetolactate synthase [Candidatus Falkowbacteria bacterium CG11_big_fil_rev_8_21_14_0_20_39_10]|uniref:Acetolactate synthase n=1 Tax=Candidatus Falkowbacteria bacterium CG11_big_fil_rev_8_21_14_0_20_39_10 TaxID=1974570 RepID=A0A2M6K9R8_9BACT|nr:MAG: acetolactate synthase [Candidatus Falkowbacteria bacterium CG11_big_fil_rev_8_21_14_0_20_39_10]